MSPDAPVAVVGAGAAGLMAAHALRTAGREVVVLEASPRVGGAIRTIARDGWLLEGGPNTVAAVPPPVEAVLDAAGILAERIVPDAAAARRFLVHDGRPVAVPSSPAEMVSTPLLSVAGRLRLLKEPFVPRGGHELETVAEFAARRLKGRRRPRGSSTRSSPGPVVAIPRRCWHASPFPSWWSSSALRGRS